MAYARFKNGIEYRPPNTGVNNNVAGDNFSGSTSETVISQVLVPANTFSVGDMIDIYSLLIKNTAGQTTMRLRIGTGGTTSDTLVATNTAGVRVQWMPLFRKFIYLGGATSNTYGFSATTSSSTFFSPQSDTTLYTLSWDKDQYVSVTSQAVNTNVVVNVKCIKLKRNEIISK
jgi:hypothetical protein